MNQKDHQLLQSKLSLLPAAERKRLYKRASDVRKRAPVPTMKGGKVKFAHDEDGEETIKLRPRSSSLDELVLKFLLEEEAAVTGATTTGPKGVVLSVSLGSCEVLREERVVSCQLTPELRMRQQTLLAVGDEVAVEGWDTDLPMVTTVLPRRTKLSRPDPAVKERERVVVANVDVVVVVVSVVAPPLHPRLIDRYLIAIRRGGAQPVLCVNKVDLLEDQSELEKLAPYRALGIPIALCSARNSEGLDLLRDELRGKLGAFVGHSGVGKSSLLNALRPELGLDTGEVWKKYGRGTHTTTASTLHDLGDGLRLIDTPGIREFGLWEVGEDELMDAFPEFEGIECRFRDCAHEKEPGCGVRAAVERGDISQDRFETFLLLKRAL